jgi:hypothetical protein
MTLPLFAPQVSCKSYLMSTHRVCDECRIECLYLSICYTPYRSLSSFTQRNGSLVYSAAKFCPPSWIRYISLIQLGLIILAIFHCEGCPAPSSWYPRISGNSMSAVHSIQVSYRSPREVETSTLWLPESCPFCSTSIQKHLLLSHACILGLGFPIGLTHVA